ncbi:hypothetical protein DAEQUDRAFT_740004 [Daedalea quercina L-15889]|uniref:Uncharacterized protein n=1 Tax=Daedalea quercina L-15889 TaxID=1314783 RepID=A0A165N2W7_9APHY|nr:hypothetical protein DAEQUDRAFT_740004 [Daedalea quercina L-15889]
MLWNALIPRAVAGYQALQEAVSLAFLEDLLRAPEQFRAHIYKHASLAFRVAYGCQSPEREGYYIQVARRFSQVTSVAVEPGRWLLESTPICEPLSYVRALTARVVVEEIANAPYAMAEGNMAVVESMGAAPTPEDEDLIKHAAASMFSGTVSQRRASTDIRLPHLLLPRDGAQPDFQKRAQDELDCVVGSARLPVLSDRENLPYVEWLIQELNRVYLMTYYTALQVYNNGLVNRLEGSWFSRTAYSTALGQNMHKAAAEYCKDARRTAQRFAHPIRKAVLATLPLSKPTMLVFDNHMTRLFGGEDDPIVRAQPAYDLGGSAMVAIVVTKKGGHLGWFQSAGGFRVTRWTTKPVIERSLREVDGFITEAGREDIGCFALEDKVLIDP